MRAGVIIVALALCGCEVTPADTRDWETAPRDYVCTLEQQTRVHTEAEWCTKNTSYFSEACYGFAYIRNCTKREASNGTGQ